MNDSGLDRGLRAAAWTILAATVAALLLVGLLVHENPAAASPAVDNEILSSVNDAGETVGGR